MVPDMQHLQLEGSIASAVAHCMKSFDSIGGILDSQGNLSQLQSALIECRGRFKIWLGNIGAHQTGKSSLDYRLRNASYVSNSVLQLLAVLDTLIDDARLMITELPQSCNSTRHNPISSDTESSEDEDTDESSELEQVFLNISELITSLYRLSKSIRNPTVTKRRMKASRLDISAFEKYDIEHARQKFPSAPAYLTSRLGKANSRRRAWLSYKELHAVKLRQPLDASDTLSETTATSFQFENKFESRDEVSVDDSASSMSETSYASSAGGSSTARMPSMPNEAKNEQLFECPYCHAIECVKNGHAWKKHVYSDLQPYVCTFEACSLSTETYGSRHAWFNHELQIHRRSWTCKEHCSKRFTTEDSMVTHILKYDLALTRSEALILASVFINPIGEVVENKCPLCDVVTNGVSQLRKHLGRHLEELALFALGHFLLGSVRL